MIKTPTPIVVPATASQVADGLWISNLQIAAPTVAGKIRIMATIVPFISSTGVLLSNQSKVLRIDDLGTLATTSTTAANAMTSLFAAINEQIIAQKLFS
jgi:hypothetical protein